MNLHSLQRAQPMATTQANRPSVALIGMPGVGKSTVGVLLAKQLGLRFIDTDLSIQQRTATTLQQFLDQHGYLALREQEQQVLLSDSFDAAVIATGGSAVYAEAGMQRLSRCARLVWLRLSADQLAARLGNFAQRGIASAPGADLAALYAERTPLYLRWVTDSGGIVIDCSGRSAEQLCAEVIAALNSESGWE